MELTDFFAMFGGLALFLYGMTMMSNGLELAAGNKMKTILEKLTTNRFLGVGVGAVITAVIQSSSATTVMTVGFVNAGLMKLENAVWVIMGANIGTTITGQLIAIDITALAPVIAFIGVDFYPLKCEAHITNFAVATPYQGQGLAKFMMKKIMDFCKDEGYKVISLEVNNNNIIAKSLYAKMGFEEGKFLKNYYTETLEDAIEMYVYL